MEKRRPLILTTFFTCLFVFFLIGVWGPTEVDFNRKLRFGYALHSLNFGQVRRAAR
jgi:hypothetical protein